MTDDRAPVEKVAEAIWTATTDPRDRGLRTWRDVINKTHYRSLAIAAIDALGLTEEWSVQGHCSESSADCDHFGNHGPWVCGAVAHTAEEAAAFPVASQPDACLVSRLQSPWTRFVGATPAGDA